MNSLVARTLNARRQYGIMGAAQAAACKLFNIKSFFVCEREFKTEDVEKTGIVRAFSLESVRQLHRQGAPLRYLPDRLGPDDILVIHHGVDGPDGLFWLSPTAFTAPFYDGLHIDLAEGDIHGRLLWVAPGARGRGLGPLLNRAAYRFCLDAGYRRVVSGVSTFNTSALRADQKVGYRPIVRVLMMRLFKLCYLDVAGIRKAGLFDSEAPLRFTLGQLRALARER
jgi:GNAT superfamily N-acetyltransferase